MWAYLVLLEAAIVGGSGLDAWIRNGPSRRYANGARVLATPATSWPRRWLWWHLCPLWTLLLTCAGALERASQRWAASAVERHRRAEAQVVLVDPMAD